MAAPIQIQVGANAQGVFSEIVRQAKRAQEIISRNPPEIKVKNFGGFKTLIADADNFSKSVSRMSSVVLTFGQTAAFIFGFENAMAALLKTTVGVEKQLTKIKVLLDATGNEFSEFSRNIFEAAKATSQSFATAAAAAEEFARQGLSVEETAKRTKDALILMNTSGISASDSVKTITVALAGFRKEVGDTTRVVNILNNVDANFAVSTEDLAAGLQRAGSTAQTVGVSFNQLIALVTSLQQTTQRGGAIIGNSLKSLFTRAERARNLDIFEGLGVQTTDAEGNIRNLVDILKEYAIAERNLGTIQKQRNREQLAGVFQINSLSALLNDLNSTYSVYDQALSKANNTTNEAIQRNEQLNKTLAGLLSQAGTGLTQFASNLGNSALSPALNNILGLANKVLDTLNNGLSGQGGGAGESLGRVIIGGLGNFIAGPGLVLIAGIAQRIGRLVAKGAFEQLRGAFELTKSSEAQLNLQQQINAVINTQDKEVQNILFKTKTRAQYEAEILATIQRQNNSLNSGAQFTGGAASRAIKGGFSAVKTFAGGYMPVGEEQNSINRGVGGASRGAKPVVIPNFNFGGGKKGGVVANTDEYIVPNYANGGSAIFNKEMVGRMGLPSGARKISAARGFVPNFTTTFGESGHISDGNLKIDFLNNFDGNPLTKMLPHLTGGEIKSIKAGTIIGPKIPNIISGLARILPSLRKKYPGIPAKIPITGSFRPSELVGKAFKQRDKVQKSYFFSDEAKKKIEERASTQGLTPVYQMTSKYSFTPHNEQVSFVNKDGFPRLAEIINGVQTHDFTAKDVGAFIPGASFTKEAKRSPNNYAGTSRDFSKLKKSLREMASLRSSSDPKRFPDPKFDRGEYVYLEDVYPEGLASGYIPNFVFGGAGAKNYKPQFVSPLDGKGRFELTEPTQSFRFAGKNIGDIFGKKKERGLSDLINFPELFNNYPILGDLLVKPISSKTSFGQFEGIGGLGQISLNRKLKESKAYSVLTHEIQHAIQSVEGSFPGDDSAYGKFNSLKGNLSGKTLSKYQAIPSEIEAIAAQKRLLEDPASPAFQTYLKTMLGNRKAAGLAGGYIPNLAAVLAKRTVMGGTERKIKIPDRKSYLDYSPGTYKGESVLKVNFLRSRQKGDGYELFGKLAELAKRSKRNIYTDTLFPQESRADFSGDNYSRLINKFPQLRYREGRGDTSGEIIDENLEKMQFSGLKDLKNKVGLRKPFGQLNNLGVTNLVTRFAKGYIPNFASPLKESMGREMSALLAQGYSKSQAEQSLRVDASSRLKNPLNPAGLGVFNTLQGQGNISKALADHAGEDLHSSGMVPNFAPRALPRFGPTGEAIDRPQTFLGTPLRSSNVSNLQRATTQSLIDFVKQMQNAIKAVEPFTNVSKDAAKQMGEYTRAQKAALNALERKRISPNDQASKFITGRRIGDDAAIAQARKEAEIKAQALKDEKKTKRNARIESGLFASSFALPFLQSSLNEVGGFKEGGRGRERSDAVFGSLSVGASAAFLAPIPPQAKAVVVALSALAGTIKAFNVGKGASKTFFEADENAQKAQDKSVLFQRNANEFSGAFASREALLKDPNAKASDIASVTDALYRSIENIGGRAGSDLSKTLTSNLKDEDKRTTLGKILKDEASLKEREGSSANFSKIIKDLQPDRAFGYLGKKNITDVKKDDKSKLVESLFASIDTSKGLNKSGLEKIAFNGNKAGELSEVIPQLKVVEGDLAVVGESLRAEIEKEIAIKLLNRASNEELSKSYQKLAVSQQTAKQNLENLGKQISLLSKINTSVGSLENKSKIDLARESLRSPFSNQQDQFTGGLDINKAELQASIQERIQSIKEGGLASVIEKSQGNLGGSDAKKTLDLVNKLASGEIAGGGESISALIDAVQNLPTSIGSDKAELTRVVDELKILNTTSQEELKNLTKISNIQLANQVKASAGKVSDVLSAGSTGPQGVFNAAITKSLLANQRSKREIDFAEKSKGDQAFDRRNNKDKVASIFGSEFNRSKALLEKDKARRELGGQDLIDNQRLSKAGFGTDEYKRVQGDINKRREGEKAGLRNVTETVLRGDIVNKGRGEIGANFQAVSGIAGQNITELVSKLGSLLASGDKANIDTQLPEIEKSLTAAANNRASQTLGGEDGKLLQSAIQQIIEAAKATSGKLSGDEFNTIRDARISATVGETSNPQIEALSAINSSTKSLLAPIVQISTTTETFKNEILERMNAAAKVASATSELAVKEKTVLDAQGKVTDFNSNAESANERGVAIKALQRAIENLQGFKEVAKREGLNPNQYQGSESSLINARNKLQNKLGAGVETVNFEEIQNSLNEEGLGGNPNIKKALDLTKGVKALPSSYLSEYDGKVLRPDGQLERRRALEQQASLATRGTEEVRKNVEVAAQAQTNLVNGTTAKQVEILQKQAISLAISGGITVPVGSVIDAAEIKKLIEDYVNQKLASENKAKGEAPPNTIK